MWQAHQLINLILSLITVDKRFFLLSEEQFTPYGCTFSTNCQRNKNDPILKLSMRRCYTSEGSVEDGWNGTMRLTFICLEPSRTTGEAPERLAWSSACYCTEGWVTAPVSIVSMKPWQVICLLVPWFHEVHVVTEQHGLDYNVISEDFWQAVLVIDNPVKLLLFGTFVVMLSLFLFLASQHKHSSIISSTWRKHPTK